MEEEFYQKFIFNRRHVLEETGIHSTTILYSNSYEIYQTLYRFPCTIYASL
jgi:hypothetical protein